MSLPATKVRYLEISPRQTGKTYRMIQDATHRRYVEDKHIIIVSRMPKSVWKEQDMIPFAKVIASTESDALEQIYKLGLKPEQCAWYYDEFDFLKGHITIREDGYYATTARFVRKLNMMSEEERDGDVLLRLVAVQRNMVTTCAVGPHRAKLYAEMADNFDPEHNRTEIHGQFWAIEPPLRRR